MNGNWRSYYSSRTGLNPDGGRLDLAGLKRLFQSAYGQLWNQGFFQEAFGYQCTDVGDVAGSLGDDVGSVIFLRIRKDNLWPISKESVSFYSEADLFDIIEFLFDNVSKPVDGFRHDWNDCGMHYTSFNGHDGREHYRELLNPILAICVGGFTLSPGGEILTNPEEGMSPLLEAGLPKVDPNNIEQRVRSATLLFRRHNSSLQDRKHALRDLADVLEFLRPQMKAILSSKDESDLFNIANNFAVRHHNSKQQMNYDTAIWCSWMFYFYLATIHACVRRVGKKPAP